MGLESAAWYYFGRSARDLSWAESALLAVLPNAPALIHMAQPGTAAAEGTTAARTDMARRAYRLPDVRPGPAGTAARSSRTDADGGDAPAGQDAHGGSLRSTLDADLQRRVNEPGAAVQRRSTGATG